MFGGEQFVFIMMTFFDQDDKNISWKSVPQKPEFRQRARTDELNILQQLIQVNNLTDYRLSGNSDFKCNTIVFNLFIKANEQKWDVKADQSHI